jgi:hypothetical protein
MVTTNPRNKPAIGFEDYLIRDDDSDRPQELVDGTLITMPPPTWMHRLIAKFLVQVLDQAIEASRRDDDWTTLLVPGQRTGEATSRLPDVAIVPFSMIEDVLASAVLVGEFSSFSYEDHQPNPGNKTDASPRGRGRYFKVSGAAVHHWVLALVGICGPQYLS